MLRTFRIAFACLGAMLFLALGTGCSNGQEGCANDGDCTAGFCMQGDCVECRSDADCKSPNKCLTCQGGSCAERGGDCCTTDLDCGQGRRCWNVPGTNYGRCGSR